VRLQQPDPDTDLEARTKVLAFRVSRVDQVLAGAANSTSPPERDKGKEKATSSTHDLQPRARRLISFPFNSEDVDMTEECEDDWISDFESSDGDSPSSSTLSTQQRYMAAEPTMTASEYAERTQFDIFEAADECICLLHPEARAKRILSGELELSSEELESKSSPKASTKSSISTLPLHTRRKNHIKHEEESRRKE